MTQPSNEDDAGTSSQRVSKEMELKEELKLVKAQLAGIFQNLNQLKSTNSSIEGSQDPPKADKVTASPILEAIEEFPALGKGIGTATPAIQSRVASWKDKVSAPISPTGMPLKFVPPSIENGLQVVHIESHDVVDLIRLWERAVVMCVVGGNVSVEIIRGFIRKHWAFVSMPTIHAHEEGYFILRFNTEEECSEILNGGPYFLNRAPMIIKKWNRNFDFKDEILRVIPVWFRLPSLPLHCWGEESLSRIVSAVGVPVLADECTSKQLKVSYARVLVEVDITQEITKEIRVRDNLGREFMQKAIPEWRPFFCRKCNKIGHECKETSEPIHTQHAKGNKDGDKEQGEKRVWIPTTIAKIMQGVTCTGDLRAKLAMECEQPRDNLGQHTYAELLPTGEKETQQLVCQHPNSNVEASHMEIEPGDEEGEWTTVSAKKSARRSPQKQHIRVINQEATQQTLGSTIVEKTGADFEQEVDNKGTQNRDGNPLIPLAQ
ncbi:unnamed protein product [Amaranthus hypochondriacus]